MAAEFGSRLRKGAATTAVAALAVAALSASQAPGVTAEERGTATAAGAESAPDQSADGGGATGNSPYYMDLPPLNTASPSPSTGSSGDGDGDGDRSTSESGIPATVLDAYQKAASELRASKPSCNLPWELLAAIGKVESGHARGGRVDANGTTTSPILGPELDGNGFALIKDTDNGVYDGNSTYDQAVGPMQFIPSTWAWAGRDGNGDGEKDPNNIYDAALAAGDYLCRNGWDLSTQGDLNSAILSYNNSQDYLDTVLSWLEYYRKGTHEIPDGTGSVPSNRSDGETPSTSTPTTPASPESHGAGKNDPGTPAVEAPSTPPATTEPSETPAAPQTPTDTVHHLEDAGTGGLTATAGDTFTKKIRTRAETKAGEAVGKVRIRFTLIGDTDTEFTTGERVATVVTGSNGVAVAPALRAGEKTGDFTVRATVVGRTVGAVDYSATVTERTADTLTRTGDTALSCTAGGEFAEQVEVKATEDGAVAGGVAATATLVKSSDDPTENDKGPYFKDADGNTVRTLTGLETDDDGLLTLPKLYADDTAGTYLLRVTTAGGASLDITLTVEAATTESPSPSETDSTSADTSA